MEPACGTIMNSGSTIKWQPGAPTTSIGVGAWIWNDTSNIAGNAGGSPGEVGLVVQSTRKGIPARGTPSVTKYGAPGPPVAKLDTSHGVGA